MTEGISVPIGEIKVEALDEAEAAAARAEAFRDEAELASSSAAGSASTATSAKNAAVAAQETVLDARDEAVESAANALQSRDEANSYQSLAEQSKDESLAASQTSVAASEVAAEARTDAVDAATTATAAATSADQDAVAAAGSRSGAQAAQNSATNSASDAATSAAAADAYADEAAAEKAEAQTARQGAEQAASNSANSATEARNAELGALAAQAAAEASQADALASAGVATTKAGEASTSAADADADRIAAQTALDGAVAAQVAAEAARAAIPSLPVLATNVIRNPRVVTNLTGWNRGGTVPGTISRETTLGPPVAPSVSWAKVTLTGAGNDSIINLAGGTVLGRANRVSGWLWSSKATTNARFRVWRYLNSTYLGAPNDLIGPQMSLAANTWTYFDVAVTGTNVEYDAVSPYVHMGVAWEVGDSYGATMAMAYESPGALTFFDGATEGARWTGAANSTSSQLVVARASDLTAVAARAVATSATAQAVIATNYARNPRQVEGGYFDGGNVTRTLLTNLTSPWPMSTGSRNTSTGLYSAVSFGQVTTGTSAVTVSVRFWATATTSGTTPSWVVQNITDNLAGSALRTTSDGANVGRVLADGVPRQYVSTVVVPANSTKTLGVKDVSGNSGSVLDVTQIEIVVGTYSQVDPYTLPAYFDGSVVGSRWAGTANSSASELVSYRPFDITGVARSALRYQEGAGSPEGVVTANPGTEYLDTAGTNGAWVWRKRTGTGPTGWGVVDGDTGWRTLTSWTTAGVVTGEALSASWAPGSGQAGYIRARRSGSTLEVAIVGLERLNTTNANVWATYVLPLGMRPAIAINSTYIVNNVSGVGAQIALGGAGTISRAFGVGAGVNGLIYQTTIVGTADPAQPWPTGNLPGTAT